MAIVDAQFFATATSCRSVQVALISSVVWQGSQCLQQGSRPSRSALLNDLELGRRWPTREEWRPGGCMKVTGIIRVRCDRASFCSLSGGGVRQIPLFRGGEFFREGGVKGSARRPPPRPGLQVAAMCCSSPLAVAAPSAASRWLAFTLGSGDLSPTDLRPRAGQKPGNPAQA